MNRRLQLLFKFLCIIIVNYCCSMQNFGGQIQQFRQVPQGANIVRIGQATAANHIDIDDWDNAQLGNVANDIFPANAFGPGIDNGRVISEMVHCFRNRRRKPHIALARIVIVDDQGNRYVYAIPHVFVSGADHNKAIGRWNNYEDLANYNNLNAAINPLPALVLPVVGLPPIRPIDDIVKGIRDYDFACNDSYQYQSFAHSERCAILCILYDQNYSIEQVLNAFTQYHQQHNLQHRKINIAQIIVQIKIAHPSGVCGYCQSFLNGIAAIRPNYETPQIGIFRPRPVSPACIFNKNKGGVLFPVREYLLAAAFYMGFDILKINLHIRVSYIDTELRLVTNEF